MQKYISEIMATHEERRREFKRSSPWEDLKWHIARTAMGMANKLDGGVIVIGVSELENGGYEHTGVSEEHAVTYDDDIVQRFINTYAAPYVKCQVHRIEHDSKNYIVIDVNQFSEMPVVCKKSGGRDKDAALIQGAVYCRSYEMPETRMVQSETEMREILDIATQYGVQEFVRRASRAGIELKSGPTGVELYDKERNQFLDDVDSSRTMGSGAMIFTIRPLAYNSGRIAQAVDILQLIRQYQVRNMGWSFPFILRDSEGVDGASAGSPYDVNEWSDYWRMYQSAQFLYASGYRYDETGQAAYDLMDEFERRMAPEGFVPSGVINFHDMVRMASYMGVLASRLASAAIYGDADMLELGVRLTHTKNRVLFTDDVRRPLHGFHRAMSDSIERSIEVGITDVVAEPMKAVAPLIAEIFQQFAMEDATAEMIGHVQESLFKRS